LRRCLAHLSTRTFLPFSLAGARSNAHARSLASSALKGTGHISVVWKATRSPLTFPEKLRPCRRLLTSRLLTRLLTSRKTFRTPRVMLTLHHRVSPRQTAKSRLCGRGSSSLNTSMVVSPSSRNDWLIYCAQGPIPLCLKSKPRLPRKRTPRSHSSSSRSASTAGVVSRRPLTNPSNRLSKKKTFSARPMYVAAENVSAGFLYAYALRIVTARDSCVKKFRR
jgi:hypothetical protein